MWTMIATAMQEVEPEGLALDLDLLYIVFYGLVIGIAVVYVRRAVKFFHMKIGGRW